MGHLFCRWADSGGPPNCREGPSSQLFTVLALSPVVEAPTVLFLQQHLQVNPRSRSRTFIYLFREILAALFGARADVGCGICYYGCLLYESVMSNVVLIYVLPLIRRSHCKLNRWNKCRYCNVRLMKLVAPLRSQKASIVCKVKTASVRMCRFLFCFTTEWGYKSRNATQRSTLKNLI